MWIFGCLNYFQPFNHFRMSFGSNDTQYLYDLNALMVLLRYSLVVRSNLYCLLLEGFCSPSVGDGVRVCFGPQLELQMLLCPPDKLSGTLDFWNPVTLVFLCLLYSMHAHLLLSCSISCCLGRSDCCSFVANTAWFLCYLNILSWQLLCAAKRLVSFFCFFNFD